MAAISERRLIGVVAAVQFINVLDFVMVMPLGPDLSAALGIAPSRLGWVTGSYALAAAVAGLVAARWLDRLDRRVALGLTLAGLMLGTLFGGFAVGLKSLLFSRLIAGAFGGPATSTALAILADGIDPQRRGRAMGKVMVAFALASTLGVPAGLWLAQLWNWRAPFIGVALLGAGVIALAMVLLPTMRSHLGAGAPGSVSTLLRREVLLSYAMTATVMAAGFSVIPNISAFVQGNLGYPRTSLDEAYFVMGLVSFALMPVAGRVVDRLGSAFVGTLGSVVLFFVLGVGFAWARLPVLALFVAFTVGQVLRNVAYNTLASKVPASEERGRFMSVQSSVQHAASALGAGFSSLLLSEGPNGALEGIPRVAAFAMVLTALLPLLLWRVERGVRRKQALSMISA
ncbi:MAG: MFS transporter [Myxococcaceae bacterium]